MNVIFYVISSYQSSAILFQMNFADSPSGTKYTWQVIYVAH